MGEIKALAGIDFLTISPKLLEELKGSTEPVPKQLDAEKGRCSVGYSALLALIAFEPLIAAQTEPIPKVSYIDNELGFRWALLQDQMAHDKLHEGIKKFAEDGDALKNVLKEKLQAA